MDTEPAAWLACSSCKGEIGFEETYYVCSVSTCQRGGTDLRFCSVECWDAHVPVMRHREAWAVEKRSPSRQDWIRDNPPKSPPSSSGLAVGTDSGGGMDDDTDFTLVEEGLPHDVLVVVSKLKAYIRARSGMNTSDGVMPAVSDHLRKVCDQAIRNAARDGRKTVMDRDFSFVARG